MTVRLQGEQRFFGGFQGDQAVPAVRRRHERGIAAVEPRQSALDVRRLELRRVGTDQGASTVTGGQHMARRFEHALPNVAATLREILRRSVERRTDGCLTALRRISDEDVHG